MAQKSLRSKSKGKSAGALRKYVGFAQKKHTTTTNKHRHSVEARARAHYINAVETAMASRVPSDQRSKLSVVRPTGPIEKQKHKKKPLTRGRRRK